ncbi:MAG: amidohydrolase family protein [Thermoanaerobaculales bacterium]
MKPESPADDLLIKGGLVIPMVRDREWFHGDVLVRNGRIEEVVEGSNNDLQATSEIDARGAAIVPGFVQGHVHVVQSLLRHQADELELLDWLTLRTWPYEAALDGDGVETAAELGIAELLCGGTTTALDFGTTHDHDRVFRAADRLGIRLVSGKTHMDIGEGTPEGLLEQTVASLAEADELGARWHGAANGRLRYAVAPRFALSCSPDLLRGCAELARQRGWLLQTHASENHSEVESVRNLTGLDNIEFLDRMGLTGNDVILAHGIHLNETEVRLLAETGTTICHCPGANLKLGSGIADVPGLLSKGVAVILGADGPPCNNRLSIFHEMSLAATLHGLRHGPSALGAWKVLAMATRDGATALHLGAEIGTLEVGKAADLVVVDLEDWSMLPGGDPAARIVYGAGPGNVRHVVVDGRPLVRDGAILSTDSGALQERIRSTWEATRARMEETR